MGNLCRDGCQGQKDLERDRSGGLAICRRRRYPIGDASLGEIVGGHFHFDLVSNVQADVVLSHFSGNVSKNGVAIDQFHPKEGALEHRLNDSYHFNPFACQKGKA